MTLLSTSAAPKARRLGLIMTQTDSEMMVFDSETNELHHLNPLATAVWAQLDGSQSIAAVVDAASADLGEAVSVESVIESIRLLSAASLLENTDAVSVASNGSRRAFLRRAAAVGAATVPVVMSITAPSASAHGSSQCKRPCTRNKDCNGPCSQCEDFGSKKHPNYLCCNPGKSDKHSQCPK